MTEVYSARDYVDIGYAAMHRNELERAVTNFEMALELDPEAFEAMNHLGMIALGAGDQEKAVAWWQKSIAIEEDAQAHYNLGFYYAQIEDDARAKPHLEKVAELNPNQGDAILKLARIEIEEGDFQQAEAHIAPLLMHEVSMEEAHILWSDAKGAQNQLDEAIIKLDAFLEKHPGSLPVIHHMARLHARSEHYDKSDQYYVRLLQFIPYNLDVIKEYGSFLTNHISAPKAVEIFLRVAQLASNDWELQLLLGQAQEKAGIKQEAASTYEHCLKLNPGLNFLKTKIELLKIEHTKL